MSAFGKSYSFGLKRNTRLLYEQAEVVLVEDGGEKK